MNQFFRYADVIKSDYFPPGKIFKIRFDANLNMMQILCIEPNTFSCMRDAFSSENKAAFYVQLYGYSASNKVYLINQFGYFKPGLFFDILNYINIHMGSLQGLYISENCKDYVSDYLTPLKRYSKNLDRNNFTVRNIAEDSGINDSRENDKKLFLRPYQIEAIKRTIFDGYGRGLIELPTSAGKSFVIANIIYNFEKYLIRGLRYLIFVPNRQLVDQFYKDLLEYGFPEKTVSTFTSHKKGDKKFNPKANVIISNRQYLFKNYQYLPKVDAIINDEVHQSKPNSETLSVVDKIDCKIKIGLSGTLPRDKYDKLSLVGSFGRVFYVESITDLQERGYISKLKINLIKIKDTIVEKNRNLLFHENSLNRFSLKEQTDIKFNDAYNTEIEYIIKNYQRLYSPILNILDDLEGNTLVLFDRIEFGQNIFELAKSSSKSKSVYYIDGHTPVKEREDNRAMMEKENNVILFGQCSILSTGINIKNLTNLVLMVSTKSFSRILQSIGRTLRLHREKEYAQIYDISFNFKYSQKHLRERLGIYKSMYNKSPDTRQTFEI